MNFLKGIGSAALGIAGFLAFLSIPAIFFIGIAKTAQYILPWLSTIAWLSLAINVFVLLPLSLIKRLRTYTGMGIFISSYVFGLLLWLFSLLTTWALWGGFWAFLGIVLFGGMVVPFALIAVLLKGLWGGVAMIIALLALTWISRLIGLSIATNGERNGY